MMCVIVLPISFNEKERKKKEHCDGPGETLLTELMFTDVTMVVILIEIQKILL